MDPVVTCKGSIRSMAYTHVTSPLRFKQTLGPEKPQLSKMDVSRQEEGFVNDAVKTVISQRAKKLPIIPVYDAQKDRECKSYFLSPMVQGVLRRTMSQDAIPLRDPSKNVNKLSYRRRCINTPGQEDIMKREETFINDAINTERRRTKYKDIIPKYDATDDTFSKRYHQRKDIKQLVAVTRSHDPSMTRNNRWIQLGDPTNDQLLREQTFINDAIEATNRKSRYYGLIPPYNAMDDTYARSFVQRELPKLTAKQSGKT